MAPASIGRGASRGDIRPDEGTPHHPGRGAFRPTARRDPRPGGGRVHAAVLPAGVGRRARRGRRHRSRPRRESRVPVVRQGIPLRRPPGARDPRGRPGSGRLARGGPRRHHPVPRAQRRADRRRPRTVPGRHRAAVPAGARDPAALPGRGPSRGGLSPGLSAPGLRSPIHPLGPQLLQVSFPEARRRALQRAAARGRLLPPHDAPAPGRRRRLPVPRLPVSQHHDPRRGAVVHRLPGRPEGAAAL